MRSSILAAALHELGPRGAAEEPCGDREAFPIEQTATCVSRQQAHGLAPEWLEQIPTFLDRVDLSSGTQCRSLLHTEIMREHLRVQPRAGGWEISGRFDFEPAMIGTPEYDFASVGVFLSGGEPGLFAAFLDGYGLPEQERTVALQETVVAWRRGRRNGKPLITDSSSAWSRPAFVDGSSPGDQAAASLVRARLVPYSTGER